MMAATKEVTSDTSMRFAMSRMASRRMRPSWISCSTRVKARLSSLSHFSDTFFIPWSKPRQPPPDLGVRDPQHYEDQSRQHDGGQHAHPEEFRRRPVLRISGQVELVPGSFERALRREAVREFGHTAHQRRDDTLAERQGKLDLFERRGLLARAVLSQPRLPRLPPVARGPPDE